MNIFDLPRTEEESIIFLQNKGILPKERVCPNGHHAKLYFGNRIFWKCTVKSCLKRVNIRTGTWFTDTRLPFVTGVRFFYSWAFELTSIQWCERELQIAKHTAVDWNLYMRSACVEALELREKKKIGGDGLIVEIDESLFTKRKNNAGRILPPQWIFGGLCRETNNCFLIQVPDRRATTLINAIKDNIAEGSIIFSDSWRGYKSDELEQAGFEHFKVNHRFHFVDPHNGAHTQNVERMWGSAKWRNKKQRGTARQHMESYLAEFMWRQTIRNKDPFDSILDLIKTYSPPEINYK